MPRDKDDEDKLFEEARKLSGCVEEAGISHLFDGVRDEVSPRRRRIRLAGNFAYAAAALRAKADELDSAATDLRQRAERCKARP